jgi:mitochondrial fission protein ELM1
VRDLSSTITIFSYVVSDKTQVFHGKIQDKQKELQPWTAQINTKQAEIDVATSERDALAKKADALKGQMKDADRRCFLFAIGIQKPGIVHYHYDLVFISSFDRLNVRTN